MLPTVGPSAPLLSYLGAFSYIRNAESMIIEGYEKVSNVHPRFLRVAPNCACTQYYGTVFKVPMLDGWLAVCTGPLIEELRKCADDELSAVEGTNQVCAISLPSPHGGVSRFKWLFHSYSRLVMFRCCSCGIRSAQA